MKPHEIVLQKIQDDLEDSGSSAIVTLYVAREELDHFEAFCARFADGRRRGRFSRILGIATEGPLFSSSGGTPKRARWRPSRAEWRRIANLGRDGLVYSVLSPDAALADDGETDPARSLGWIVECLMDGGVMPALGHFSKDDPDHSAAKVREILSCVGRLGRGPIVTDHLFNDMPLNFRHAWRTPAEFERRATELADADLDGWSRDNLETKLGLVPAAIIHGAFDGLVKICMNFDGAHVDLAVCARTVEVVGSEHLMLMTDRIQSAVLGGQQLRPIHSNSLLYQEDGIVAGGTTSVWQEVGNLVSMGLSTRQITDIACMTAQGVLGVEARATAPVLQA
ncbi:MAG: hypothetical protein ING46_18690 [Rubrivivax sp.]|nr:hypothetical protein [Rubrivivax sp.]